MQANPTPWNGLDVPRKTRERRSTATDRRLRSIQCDSVVNTPTGRNLATNPLAHRTGLDLPHKSFTERTTIQI
eukprot:m.41566 g.41566  ORF g.41566 m.41566 type:complete len:73 (-) comp8223_c0_seq2:1348-1566(-)